MITHALALVRDEPRLLTNEQVEDISLLVLYGVNDFNAAAHIVFDRLGIPMGKRYLTLDERQLMVNIYIQLRRGSAARTKADFEALAQSIHAHELWLTHII